jgi:hypothetical protein
VTGIRYFRIKDHTLGSYGWHMLHDGIGFRMGCGYQIQAKYLTLGRKEILLQLKIRMVLKELSR